MGSTPTRPISNNTPMAIIQSGCSFLYIMEKQVTNWLQQIEVGSEPLLPPMSQLVVGVSGGPGFNGFTPFTQGNLLS